MSKEQFVQDFRHSYPGEFVSFILDRWKNPPLPERLPTSCIDPACQLPDRSVLEQIISICYQASLKKEEGRPVMFRLILGDHYLFHHDCGPPTGLHSFRFEKMRPLTETELYRLAPAADFYRALIGVTISQEKRVQIWGLVHTGTLWLQPINGGTKALPSLPLCPVIYVTGPGRISVGMGSNLLASLNGGQMVDIFPDFFSAPWLAESFAAERLKIKEVHEAARERSIKPWARLDPDFDKMIGQQVILRIISLIRSFHHGGMLVYLPTDISQDVSVMKRYISLKYQFYEEEPRLRFRTLMLRIMNTFAELHGESGNIEKVVGWQEYVNSTSEAIALLDEAIFNLAHFVAGLSAVDGALVLTKQQEILGFGGVISGDLEEVGAITNAYDIEGRFIQQEPSEDVGTRHRAAYRLCNRLHGCIVIVVSQDGNTRFVKWFNGSVTYWDLASTGVPEF
jgi:hypothetical protein